jgi:hypothetical protein
VIVDENETATLTYVVNERQVTYNSYVINCIARWRRVRDRATDGRICIRTGPHRSDDWYNPNTVAIRRQLTRRVLKSIDEEEG